MNIPGLGSTTPTDMAKELENTACDNGFPWPPQISPPERGHMGFFRTTYDLKLSDPTPPNTIIIKVGAEPDLATFHLPARDLKATSVFFQRALKPEWLDPSLTIHLPKVDAKLFG
jgi:hypothetical protein